MPTVFLRGEKVRLKPLETEEDVKFIFHSLNDPEAQGQYINFEPHTWENFQAFSKEWEKPPFQFTAFLIERNEDKKAIGYVVHFFPNPIFRGSIEIGYGINDPALRGKGYTSEAAKLLVDYLFSTKMIERLQATTSPGNIASQRIVQKLGFKKEGVLRSTYFVNGRYDNSVIFGLLRKEWEEFRNKQTSC